MRLIILFFLSALLLPFPFARAISSSLDLYKLHEQIFRLKSGPFNHCPDKIGFMVQANGSELKIFPMEPEWEKINSNIQPFVEVKAIRRPLDPPKIEKMKLGTIETIYSAELQGKDLSAIARTSIEGENTLSTHTRIQFIQNNKINLTRWIKTFSGPLGEGTQCEYKKENSKNSRSIFKHQTAQLISI